MFPVFHGHDGLFVSIMSFTLRKQYDSMQCGIACLQMVCKYFGRDYSLDSLSKLCFATTEGVSMLGINEAANMLGLHTVSARATTTMFGEAPLPCIHISNIMFKYDPHTLRKTIDGVDIHIPQGKVT